MNSYLTKSTSRAQPQGEDELPAADALPNALARRLLVLGFVCSPLTACEAKHMPGVFEVVLFSYLNRPIFDVLLSGHDIGVAGAFVRRQAGGGSMSGVAVKYEPHKVSWRFADTGQTVHAKNQPALTPPPKRHRFLCVHVYPDDTVELVTSEHFPTQTDRGVAMGEAAKEPRVGQ